MTNYEIGDLITIKNSYWRTYAYIESFEKQRTISGKEKIVGYKLKIANVKANHQFWNTGRIISVKPEVIERKVTKEEINKLIIDEL